MGSLEVDLLSKQTQLTLSVTFLEIGKVSGNRASLPERIFNQVDEATLFNQVVARNRSFNQIHER